MKEKAGSIFFLLFFLLSLVRLSGQNSYLKANAICVDNPVQLSDSVYTLLSPFQVIMMGEMHGTKEPAQFVVGLANLFSGKGDSVSVGLEIPSDMMADFLVSRSDSSIYQSRFFGNPPYLDGRESFAWARVIADLKNNPKVQLFFFDVNEGPEKQYDRDSMMYLNIKKQIELHPGWKMVTLSGNAHNLLKSDEKKTAMYLREDKRLNLSPKVCAINNYYLQGNCRANFGHGLEVRTFSRPANYLDTTFSFDKYLLLLSPQTSFPYTALYYTKTITDAEMAPGQVDVSAIKAELAAIYDRDQKTRTGRDSAAFVNYIDSCNLSEVERLIAKYGWPGISFVGGKGNQAVFLVIQHADLVIQEKYFPLLQQSVQAGESRASEMAMMQDRILMRQGKKQIYGSQVVFNNSGGQEFYPIEDEKNVNIRRAKVGLPPIEEYAKHFGIDYK